MTRRPFLGSRLHSQIVYPLVGAAVVLGVVATSMSLYFVGTVSVRWVGELANYSTTELAQRAAYRCNEMRRIARYIALSDPRLREGANGGHQALQQCVVENSAAFNRVMIVTDSRGRVLAASGAPGVARGDLVGPLGAGVGSDAPRLLPVGPQRVLGVAYPIECPGRPGMLVIGQLVDGGLLRSLSAAGETTFALLTPDRRLIAVSPARTLSSRKARELEAWLMVRPASFRSAVEDALGPRHSGFFQERGTSYEVVAHPLAVEPDGIYVLGIVSQGISERAGRQTVNMISGFSLLGVVALAVLGSWVATRVGRPIVELSDSARRIAAGDYETKVRVKGAEEIADLADSFNQMTDSLQDRTDNLTKKVSELASLYEMSRSLSGTLELDELLESVLDSALAIFNLELGHISLVDAETGELELRAARVQDRDAERCGMRSSMAEWVVREGRPLIFNPDAANAGSVDGITGARAALCVPLVAAEGPIGSIAIGSADGGRRFGSDDVRLLSTIANHVTIAIGNISLFSTLQEAYLATVRSLAAAVDAKDTYTRGHSDRVATYAVLIAEKLGLSHEQRTAVEVAAYLHDIGKIGVREDILLKPGALDAHEIEQMRHHPLIGANILKPVAFPWQITPIVRHHHEAWDGSGYPAGLKGEEIPLLARILSVADSFEAMTSDRPYRRGRDAEEAAGELLACCGTQFDSRIVEVFVGLLRAGEADIDTRSREVGSEVTPDEARAIFSALVEGLFASFKRLGGSRLAANLQIEYDAELEKRGKPFRVRDGRVVFDETDPCREVDEVIQMRAALRLLEARMSRACGATLVEHFYTDALDGLSTRMRALALRLGFHDGNGKLPH